MLAFQKMLFSPLLSEVSPATPMLPSLQVSAGALTGSLPPSLLHQRHVRQRPVRVVFCHQSCCQEKQHVWGACSTAAMLLDEEVVTVCPVPCTEICCNSILRSCLNISTAAAQLYCTAAARVVKTVYADRKELSCHHKKNPHLQAA